MNTTRPVRYLLLSGADVNIEDRYGRKPTDYIRDIHNADLQVEMMRMLVQ